MARTDIEIDARFNNGNGGASLRVHGGGTFLEPYDAIEVAISLIEAVAHPQISPEMKAALRALAKPPRIKVSVVKIDNPDK